MLKFQSICACVALGVVSVLTIPMDMDTVTTIRPEATTEDTSGRLLSLPNPEKCANSKSWILIHSILIFTKSKLNRELHKWSDLLTAFDSEHLVRTRHFLMWTLEPPWLKSLCTS